jgi:hypothetical protein
MLLLLGAFFPRTGGTAGAPGLEDVMRSVVGISRRTQWGTFFLLVVLLCSFFHEENAEARRRSRRRGGARTVQQRRVRRGRRGNKRRVVVRRNNNRGRFNRFNRRFNRFEAPALANNNRVLPIFNDFNGNSFNPFFASQLGGNPFANPFLNDGLNNNFFDNFRNDRRFNRGLGDGRFVTFGNNIACSGENGSGRQCFQIPLGSQVINGQLVSNGRVFDDANGIIPEGNFLETGNDGGQVRFFNARQPGILRAETQRDMRLVNSGELQFSDQNTAIPENEGNVVSLRRFE